MAADLDPADPDVARILPKMKRGDLSKMSFGFSVDRGAEEWDQTGDIPVRTIRKVSRLYDVSIVTEPAYAGTEIALRSLQDARGAVEARAAHSACALAEASLKSRLAALI
jgi:HK97 family phage prohead protease